LEVAKADEVVIPVQVNGKVRARLTVPADASEEALRETALADEGVQSHIAGKSVKKVVVVNGRLVSIVVA
jgi:leucyl-tRNA synthetase